MAYKDLYNVFGSNSGGGNKMMRKTIRKKVDPSTSGGVGVVSEPRVRDRTTGETATIKTSGAVGVTSEPMVRQLTQAADPTGYGLRREMKVKRRNGGATR